MGTAIPARSRQRVKQREQGQCFRCGAPTANGDWHHRRSRSVKDQHQHCTCNGVWLCRTCHDWVHAHPFEARTDGLIVSRHESKPGGVVALTFFGTVLLDCQGTFNLPKDEEEES